jgi:hypothetical protein
MKDFSEREIGHLFGLIGGIVLLAGALLAMLTGAVDLALGRMFDGSAAVSQAIVLGVVGGLVLAFSQLGKHAWGNRPVTSGVLLVVLALVGWIALGLGSNVLGLLGGLLALMGGLLYLMDPVLRAASSLVYAR